MVREDGHRSVEGVLSTGSAKSGCAARRRNKARKLAVMIWHVRRMGPSTPTRGLPSPRISKAALKAERPREHGKAGPGRDYWIKEIREREADDVRRAEQAYERMVAAWKESHHGLGHDRYAWLTIPSVSTIRGHSRGRPSPT